MRRTAAATVVNRDHIRCAACDMELVPMPVKAKYLKSDFPTKVLACPSCGQLYIPEELVFSKIAEVEHTLEEK